MDWTTTLIIGTAITAFAVGAYFALNFYKKRNIEKLFNQVYEMAKQVPKQKKHSFLLLMFKETMTPRKKKDPSINDRLGNQKYIEVQLIQMTNILKDTTNVKDKVLKNALKLFKDYLAWEKVKNAKSSEKKTS
jgi:hypothetical protein